MGPVTEQSEHLSNAQIENYGDRTSGTGPDKTSVTRTSGLTRTSPTVLPAAAACSISSVPTSRCVQIQSAPIQNLQMQCRWIQSGWGTEISWQNDK